MTGYRPATQEGAPDWSLRACEGMGDLFFPDGVSGARAREQIAEAKTVCRGCPIAPGCLEWAMSTRQEFGVWGGLSEDERFNLRRRRTRKPRRKASA